jgi:hypothetical protein
MTKIGQPTRPPMPAEPPQPRGGGPIRSRPVRRVLRLERQAARQAIRYDQAQARADRLGRRATDLRCAAEDLQERLTASQRAELARARREEGDRAAGPAAPEAPDEGPPLVLRGA